MVGPIIDSEMMNEVVLQGAQSDIVFFQNIEPEGLRYLYSSAEFFMFPSLNEGFGWPVAEAQACGCPVFASNVPPMPEVGGDGAVYFSPYHVEDAIEKVLMADLAIMSKAGSVNAERFCVDLFAERMISEIVLD